MQKVLKEAALHTEKFSKTSGIACASKCHLCCLKKDISASPLEFLPLAYHLVKNGQADAFYDRLEILPKNELCILFSAIGDHAGGCSQYPDRGLICRLFGYAANRDKQGQSRLVTCKTIKESTTFSEIKPAQMKKAPIMSEYYTKLAAIDFNLANEQMQINDAIKRALELVLTYYMYRRSRKLA
ncbi:YkgJ family cysteine cluster protein [Mangrovibacterium sp.]|uniref:YkgJ family cysteine cluster protein n=1 Tax=Mangrovibacterium sp. TaxID=1961364 RepID=UPI00356A923C